MTEEDKQKERRRARMLKDHAKEIAQTWERFREARRNYLSSMSIQGLTLVLIGIEFYRLFNSEIMKLVSGIVVLAGMVLVGYSMFHLHKEYKALRSRTEEFSESSKESFAKFAQAVKDDLEDES